MYIPDFLDGDTLVIRSAQASVSTLGATLTVYPMEYNGNNFFLGFTCYYSGNVIGAVNPGDCAFRYSLLGIGFGFTVSKPYKNSSFTPTNTAHQAIFTMQNDMIDVSSFCEGVLFTFGTINASDTSAIVQVNTYWATRKVKPSYKYKKKKR